MPDNPTVNYYNCVFNDTKDTVPSFDPINMEAVYAGVERETGINSELIERVIAEYNKQINIQINGGVK